MSPDQPLGRVVAYSATNLPATKEEGKANGFDGRAWLADWLEALARDNAEAVFLSLGGFMAESRRTISDLAAYIEAQGMAVLEAWADLMTRTRQDREPWARQAANRAALAYRDRLAALIASGSDGGWA